jgi:hypothetical protein
MMRGIQNPLVEHHNGRVVVIMSRYKAKVAWVSLSILFWGFPALALAQSQEPPMPAGVENGLVGASAKGASAHGELPEPQSSGSISGTIVDRTGAFILGARVKLTREDPSQNQEIGSDNDGQFSFANVAPGTFQLTITLSGFATQTFSGMLSSGEAYTVPQTTLAIASANTEVLVVPTVIEEAEDEIKEQEKQRVLGVIPNFYVSYISNAAPLSPKQKFELAWKTSVDPVTFGLNGAIAGIQQAQDEFSGYGQGAQGYAKRYGASYANLTIGTFIGGAILPSIFKQDPRYFYKGTGSARSRIMYAIANAVICKGDNKRWQANYSAILGGLAAGGISNLYYPSQDRNGAALTFESALIGIGESAAANIFQEFVVRRLTPGVSKGQQSQP